MKRVFRASLASSADFVRASMAMVRGPWPRARMLRSGGSIGIAFLVFAMPGSIEAAVFCALYTNLLVLTDQGGTLRTRLVVLLLAAASMTAAGALGALLAGSQPLILVATFALAVFAGLLHSSMPGVEMVPRNALICFVVGAYIPIANGPTISAIGIGSLCALAGILAEHARWGAPAGATAGTAVSYPGPRFSAVFGTVAVCGLLLGQVLGTARPYWVTITTLVVMQPDRRAATLRVLQRFGGTTGGVVLAYVTAILTPAFMRNEILLVLALVLPFIWPLSFARNYGLGVIIISTWILLLLDMALPSDETIGSLFAARLADTAAGCALALLGNLLLRETQPGDLDWAETTHDRDAEVPSSQENKN